MKVECRWYQPTRQVGSRYTILHLGVLSLGWEGMNLRSGLCPWAGGKKGSRSLSNCYVNSMLFRMRKILDRKNKTSNFR